MEKSRHPSSTAVICSLAADDNAYVRRRALYALAELHPRSQSAVEILTNRLKDPESVVRAAAAYGLSAYGTLAQSAVPHVRNLLNDVDPLVRANAIAVLGISSDTEVDGKLILESLADENELVRYAGSEAFCVLVRRSGRSQQMTDLISYLCSSANVEERLLAIRGIAILDSIPLELIIPLKRAMLDSDERIRKAVFPILSCNSPLSRSDVIAILARTLSDSDAEIRKNAAIRLGDLGKDATETVSALSRCLSDNDADVRFFAAQALTLIAPELQDPIPCLAGTLLTHPNEAIRSNAAKALSRLGKKASKARDALESALEDASHDVQEMAKKALLQFQSE